MNLHIKTIYGLSERKVVGYEFRHHRKDERMSTVINEPQPVTDMEMLRAVIQHVERSNIPQDVIFFVHVSRDTLAYRESFTQWSAVLAELQATWGGKCVVQIGHHIPDGTLEQRWQTLRNVGVGLSMVDYGYENSRLERLREHDWDYCWVEAQRTVTMTDASALMLCKSRSIRVIAQAVQSQSQSIVALLSGQDWQEGRYCDGMANSDSTVGMVQEELAGAFK